VKTSNFTDSCIFRSIFAGSSEFPSWAGILKNGNHNFLEIGFVSAPTLGEGITCCIGFHRNS
jgi:hypothetical protein